MAKFLKSGKWKKGLSVGLSLAMAATLSLGVFSACKAAEEQKNEEEPEESAALPTDTQLLKNGNFEFYSEMTKEESELKSILNSPTSWSFSSGSPSSDTKSGLIDTKYWTSITQSSYEYSSVADAYAKWDEGSIYDKLFFFDKCKNSSDKEEYDPYENDYEALEEGSDEKKFFDEHSFSSVDYEDVQYLASVKTGLGASVPLHADTESEKSEERGILMIHNRRTSDNAVGTAQSYSSSTTLTLKAGTSAKISVWVKTAQLRHYNADSKEEGSELDGLKVSSQAGAYIGVTQTVGGTTLDQMQIKNINTEVTNPDKANNGWEQYTVYVRASTFATTTVKLVLGLGQGNSDNRIEAVDGYALFDDATLEVIDNDAYAEATKDEALGADYKCDIDTDKDAKLFDATKLYNDNNAYKKTFAIDLFAGFDPMGETEVNFGLTEEKSGNNVYTSQKIDPSLGDNTADGTAGSITKVMSLDEIKNPNAQNGYLKSIAAKDFANFPDSFNKDKIIMLLSSNGAAYTAKITQDAATDGAPAFTVKKDEPLLISFFVKTSKIISGRTGAGITLVDGENKTQISAFDSTTVDKTNIGTEGKDGYQEDIYDGWVQCFFFVSNDTETDKSFHLEFTYGPTSIASSDKYDYGQGYAALANFQMKSLSKTEHSYATTGDRAKKVTLTGIKEDTTVFDSVTASSDIENGLGTPVSFSGVVAGSNQLKPDGNPNTVPEGLQTGLLNHKHIDKYLAGSENWNTALKTLAGSSTGEEAWSKIFGDSTGIRTAVQPLVIMNTSNAPLSSYGYYIRENASVSADSYQKISLRVKLSKGAKATVYLTDVTKFKDGVYDSFLSPIAPKVTYWYDDDGNICKSDPTKSGFNKNTGTAFEVQKNGLYKKADSTDNAYYANLKNYEVKDGNLVTKSGSIAFYGNDGKYYAYRTEKDDGTYTYDTPVLDLYENGGKEIARYDYTDKPMPDAKIEVVNPSSTEATDWITVTFYVHTGNEEKNYRLELWAGDRKNAEDGIPANGYIFFDRYSSASTSNYDKLIEEAVADLEDDTDITLGDNGNLPESLARYYTYTYYDWANYLRYDETEDADGAGNPYESYKQSDNKEDIVYLIYNDEDGARTGSPSYTHFVSYAAINDEPEKATEEEEEEPAEGEEGEGEETEEENAISTGDILLIVSSALLGVVLILVIVLLLVRHFLGKRRKRDRVKPVKDSRYRPSKKEEPKEESEEENPFVKNRKEKEKAAKKQEESKEEPVEETPAVEEPTPAEEPAEQPAEEPAEQPAEEPAEPPEQPAEEPAETVEETPAEPTEPDGKE